jgi:L-2-hydroxyglutarate oxidase LhgO
VEDLRLLEPAEVKKHEPEVQCEAALISPSTGIVDSHSFMLALQGDIEDAGGMVALNAPVEAGCISSARGNGDGAHHVQLDVGGEAPMQLACKTLINSAGLSAPHVAHRIQGLPSESVPSAFYAKGNYYSLIGKSPFSRLVYPVPEQAGLGVHATVDLGGNARFGPDVEWVADDTNYDVDPKRADSFYAEVRKYWPALKDGALVPDYSGIRPKIQAPGKSSADFVVSGPADHGIPGVVNLFGIESPGLTASLAIAERVLEAVGMQPEPE